MPKYEVNVLSPKEFEKVARSNPRYSNVLDPENPSAGFADVEKGKVFILHTQWPEVNRQLLHHELDHLVEEHATDVDENGIRHKKFFKSIAPIALPILGGLIGGPLLGGLVGGLTGLGSTAAGIVGAGLGSAAGGAGGAAISGGNIGKSALISGGLGAGAAGIGAALGGGAQAAKGAATGAAAAKPAAQLSSAGIAGGSQGGGALAGGGIRGFSQNLLGFSQAPSAVSNIAQASAATTPGVGNALANNVLGFSRAASAPAAAAPLGTPGVGNPLANQVLGFNKAPGTSGTSSFPGAAPINPAAKSPVETATLRPSTESSGQQLGNQLGGGGGAPQPPQPPQFKGGLAQQSTNQAASEGLERQGALLGQNFNMQDELARTAGVSTGTPSKVLGFNKDTLKQVGLGAAISQAPALLGFGQAPEVPDLGQIPSIQALRNQAGQPLTEVARTAQARLGERLNESYQGLPPDVAAGIKRQYDQERQQLASQFKMYRPNADIATDSQFNQKMQDLNAREAEQVAQLSLQERGRFETRQGGDIATALGIDEQTLNTLIQLANTDISTIMTQLGLDAQEAQDFRTTFGQIGATVASGGRGLGNVSVNLGG